VSVVFHLNKEAKRELNVNPNKDTLPFSEPTYLGVTLDRMLTYRRQLESARKKLTSGVALLRGRAGSGWGAGATTLRIATLALIHSTTEYGGPVWCRSAQIRDDINDDDTNVSDDINETVTGCLRPTPAVNLSILPGFQPAELRRSGATHSLARPAMEPGHLLHSVLSCPPSANARCLKSTHPFAAATQQLISSTDNNRRAAVWAVYRWNADCLDRTTRLHTFNCNTGTHPPGMALPRTTWVRLLWLKLTPTYLYEKDNDVWRKKVLLCHFGKN